MILHSEKCLFIYKSLQIRDVCIGSACYIKHREPDQFVLVASISENLYHEHFTVIMGLTQPHESKWAMIMGQ